jgi:hypothetical protein
MHPERYRIFSASLYDFLQSQLPTGIHRQTLGNVRAVVQNPPLGARKPRARQVGLYQDCMCPRSRLRWREYRISKSASSPRVAFSILTIVIEVGDNEYGKTNRCPEALVRMELNLWKCDR